MDEPTIGLDVLAKEKIRRFIQEMNQTRKVTVLITSHDMDDIEQICKRTMIIDCGRLVYDGRIDNLKAVSYTHLGFLWDGGKADGLAVLRQFKIAGKTGVFTENKPG